MRQHASLRTLSLASALFASLASPHMASADDLDTVLNCQRMIARAGARFALQTVQYTLNCTNAVVACQIKCESGFYGPSCDSNPPPCCDPDDTGSNPVFAECMLKADQTCDTQADKTSSAEFRKQIKVNNACNTLTPDQLCGANTPGLNFAALAAGCSALIPGWQCSVQGILDCVGGPLQQSLGEQIGELLDPRASEALGAAGVNTLTGIERTVKVNETLPAGMMDVWEIAGTADDPVNVTVRTRDDTGSGTSTLEPVLSYSGPDSTPVPNTNIVPVPCSRPNTCGRPCGTFKRRFPVTGTYRIAVKASTANGCAGGKYKLVVTTKGGVTPTLVMDDVPPGP